MVIGRLAQRTFLVYTHYQNYEECFVLTLRPGRSTGRRVSQARMVFTCRKGRRPDPGLIVEETVVIAKARGQSGKLPDTPHRRPVLGVGRGLQSNLLPTRTCKEPA